MRRNLPSDSPTMKKSDKPMEMNSCLQDYVSLRSFEILLVSYLAWRNIDTRSSSSICYREHLVMKSSTVKDSKFPTTSFQNKQNKSSRIYYILFSVLYLFICSYYSILGIAFICLFKPLLLRQSNPTLCQRLMDLLE